MTRNYKQEAEKLAKVVDIAIESFQKYRPVEVDENVLPFLLKTYTRWKDEALNPNPRNNNLKSLDFLHTCVFTPFQEGKGETYEYFWKRLKEENLYYKRVDKLSKILKRKRIVNEEEYEFINIALVPLKQEGTINDEEFEKLSDMLGAFEMRTK